MDSKDCARCHTVKPLDDFPRANGNKLHGRHSYCRACHRARYEEKKDHVRLNNRRNMAFRRYGLTLEEYDSLVAQPCTVCGATDRRIVLDHDHVRNAVRAPLCTNCNAALGLADDDPDRLEAMADYLRQMNAEDLEPIPEFVDTRGASLRLAWAEGRQRGGGTVTTGVESNIATVTT